MAKVQSSLGINIDVDTAGATPALKSLQTQVTKFTKDAKRVDSATGSFIKLRNAVDGVGGLMASLGVAAAAMAVGQFAIESVRAFAASEASAARLRIAVQNTGAEWGQYEDRLNEVIKAQMEVSAFDDEMLAEALATLTTATGSTAKAMELLAGTTDLARLKGKDLVKTAEAVGKAYNGNTGALKKLNVSVREGASGSQAIADAFRVAEGAAAAYGSTSAGVLEKNAVAWENLKEAVGELAAPGVSSASQWFQRVAGEVETATRAFAQLPPPIQAYISELSKIRSINPTDIILGIGKAVKAGSTATGEANNATNARTQSLKDQAVAAQGAEESEKSLTETLMDAKEAGYAAEQADINLIRAKQRLKDAQKAAAEAAKEHGKRSREYRDAALDARQASLDLKKAQDDYAKNKSLENSLDAEAKKARALRDALNQARSAATLAMNAAARASGGRPTGGATAYASGGIVKASPGGTRAIVAEAGSDEAIIPINQRERSYALLAETMRRMGVTGGGPQINITGSAFDAQVIATIVRAQLAQASNPVPSVG